MKYKTRRYRECVEVCWTGPVVYIIENLEEKRLRLHKDNDYGRNVCALYRNVVGDCARR